jgi:tRNA A-37 threonylcarbamoyl transferase component Bud32/tetratricopeptide (TPR) repeat protein
MNQARDDRLEQLFEEASALPLEQRAAFFEQVRQTDEDLLPTLEVLLADRAKASGFGDRVVGPTITRVAAFLLGDSDRLRSALAERYSIELELGAGGMATVYLARDLKHDRRVALKVLHPQLAAHIGAQRFLKEIKTTAQLHHPHILPLFDSGEAAGLLFYVMPYVDGESLRQRITREKRLPVADAVRITSEVVSALDYAHRHGVIHRDIKPENILLHDGRALVADFGIALAPTTGDGRLTEAGMSVGTPAYMSPEQALGERHLDARSDIYAVGVMLYEMLTGAPPFAGSSAQSIVAKVITEKPMPPSRLRKEIPANIEDAVLTALQKNPADRFPTAAALQAAIEGRSALRTKSRNYRRTALWLVGGAGCAIAIGAFALRPLQARRAIAVRAPPDTAAKRLVAQAQEFARQRDNKSCDMAIKLFSQATDKDTTYAEAWGGLAKTRALCAIWGPGDPNVEFAAAKGASETALRLDSTLSGAYTARGMVHLFHEQDWPGAERDFKLAIRFDSTQYEPWLFRTWYYLAGNHVDSAVLGMRHAKELAPVEPIVGARLATALRYQGHVDQADAELAEILERDPGNLIAHRERFEVEVATKPCDSATRDLPWVENDDHVQIRGIVEYHWASCGEAGRARSYADSLEAEASHGSYVDFFFLATVYAGLGDSAKVLQSLDQAVTQHNRFFFLIRYHFAFRGYLGKPEVARLMKRAHLQ